MSGSKLSTTELGIGQYLIAPFLLSFLDPADVPRDGCKSLSAGRRRTSLEPRLVSFLDLISGRQRGLGPSLLRFGLAALEPLYAAAVELRNLSYDRGCPCTPMRRATLPVISIGNITTGGTGKTPMTAWIARRLQTQGRRPVLLSRGYKSLNGTENDEKRLLDELLPGVPHLQNPDRVQAAQTATEQQLGDVLILDDGFQHRRLHRDLDIVLIDAVNPWGYGHLLPRGLLRERLGSLRRADVIVITRTELVSNQDLKSIRGQIARYTSVPMSTTQFVPSRLVASDGETLPLETLRESAFAAFCGVGNPHAFREALERVSGRPLVDFREFPDHCHYTASDLDKLRLWDTQRRIQHLITTRKDLVKIRQPMIGNCRLWALDIELVFTDLEAELSDALKRVTD